MSSKETGGPAFPVSNGMVPDVQGMTLRDYFAAKAMAGMLANPKLQPEILKRGQSWIESSAWAWADAMLAERNK